MHIDWQETTALATFGLVLTSFGAILYASKQLHNERNYRQMANLERQLSFFLSEGFLLARRKLAEDRLVRDDQPDKEDPTEHRSPAGERMTDRRLKPLDPEDPPLSVFEVLDFYEHVALLVKKDHLDVYDVWHTFYEWLQPVYFDMKSILENENGQWTDHYSDLRKLMGRLESIQRTRMIRRGRKAHKKLWTEKRIVEHYEYEIQVGGRPRRIRAGA